MGKPTAFAIRRASSSDAVALAALARDTFVETFGHLYRPEDLAAFLKTSQSVTAYAPLLKDPRVAIWVAEDSRHALVGFLTAGPCKLPVPQREAMAGEIRQLYLRASVQRDGLGTCLLVMALEWLAAQGHSPLYVGVWSGNLGAQRLYARYGFEKIGEYDFPVGKHLDREFILRQRKTPPLTSQSSASG
jgi:GNAT superfamily N-acetyltransferase